MGATVTSYAFDAKNAFGKAANQSVLDIIAEFEASPDLSFTNYQFREFAENFPDLRLERAPSRVDPSDLAISSTSKALIIACEVSSEAVYIQKYQRPIWPGGHSGITVGIGYDLGYVSPDESRRAWEGYLDHSALDSLTTACGLKGNRAKEMLAAVNNIVVGWDHAKTQFSEELKRYVGLAQKSLPNFSSLSEHSRGAIVSLVYNRGPSFDASGPRYQEMRRIREHMIVRDFSKIPNELRAMTRLWPDMKGLLRRREAEASLFEMGLQ
ncbi:hypothetical protein [Azospirillum brasilense]|uniref:hypothetical protein n=1 Tax=Azospirillum brasilense TaxID=192 RepID=UPI001177AAEA|nr:hypothetical protein [Azospirillum brasilense]